MAETALSQLASSGVLGVVLVLTLLALWTKDKELTAVRIEYVKAQDVAHAAHNKAITEESLNRINDSKNFNQLAMTIQKEVIVAITKLGELVDVLERQRLDNERREEAERLGYRGRQP